MTLTTFLKPRKEVLSEEGIEGIVDLANLHDTKGRKLEARPTEFLNLTYPTADVRTVVEHLNDRFSTGRDRRTAGLFLLEGLKGSGKSHLLALVYHLFTAPLAAKEWLRRHGLACSLPTDVLVIDNKFTDFPLFSVWDFIFEKVTGSPLGKRVVQPSLQEVKDVLGEKRLVLIFDEVERGIISIADDAVRQQNLAFLQMLSEWANREDQVTLFISIYGERDEPASTLKRVEGGSCRVKFGHAPDKARVVLHRIFENYLDFDSRSALPVVDSYINSWRSHIRFNADDHRSEMLGQYPFLPDLLDVILERIPARGGFQSVRGALGFLANMVRLSYQDADIITAGHAPLRDREVIARLGDLDVGGDIIRAAQSDLKDVGVSSLASEIIATVLLYTLSGVGRSVGVSRDELLRHVLRPGVNINDIEEKLLELDKLATYLHFDKHDSRYFFDTKEKPQARVEYRSNLFSRDQARQELRKLWKEELFREPNAVVFAEVESTRKTLEDGLEKDRLRYILAPRRLTMTERHDLYYGLSWRNQVVLLEPRDDTFDLDEARDPLKWAQRVLAARDLSASAQEADRRASYDSIASEDKGNILRTMRKAGLALVRWEKFAANVSDDRVDLDQLGTASSKDEVLNQLNQNIFPSLVFEEHLGARLAGIKDRAVSTIHDEYRSTLGYPVPTLHSSVSKAIRSLCRLGKLSVRHQRGNYCRQDPPLTETELAQASIDSPFDPQAGVQSTKLDTPAAGEVQMVDGDATSGSVIAVTPVTPVLPAIEISVPPQIGMTALRQEVAARLQPYPDAVVKKVRFTVYLDSRDVELSTLPSGLRGNLSGPGAISVDVTLTKEGAFTKAQVEQLAESLPLMQSAEYGATLFLSPTGTERERDVRSD